MRKLSYLVLGAVMGAGAATIATQAQIGAVAASSETYRKLNLFGDIFDRVRSDYVEAPDESKLIDSAINGMLTSLDPHSSYLDPKGFRDMREQTRGEFGGLGIEVTMEDGLIKVVAPMDETPAAKAGILANDLISHIDDEPVQGLSLNQAVDKMRGPINTKVKLKVLRNNRKDTLEFAITRDRIQPRVVRWQEDGGDLGYIRISSFNEQTSESLRKAVDDLSTRIGSDKLKGFVIDLRNNPGGLLDQAVAVSDAFLDRGEIVSTRGRQVEETQRYNAKPGDITKGKPVIVLINGGSASASEIVAGALQDHKRATIVGSRSFGKGSVQTIIPLREQGALRLTTARYYTPSGKSIQAKGIEPDIAVLQDVPDELKGKDESKGESGLRGHIRAQDGVETSGSSVYVPRDQKADKQLQQAFNMLRGIKVDEPAKTEAPKTDAPKTDTPKTDAPKQ